MLSLLTCSAPPLDEHDPFPSPPPSPRPRRASRTLSFIRTPSKRKVSKMSIGAPANFRHEFHLGMDIVSSDAVSLWDAARFLEELRAQQNTPSSSSAPSLAPSAQSLAPPCPPAQTLAPPPCTPPAQKRNSITPQKRKPVPALVPPCPPRPADVPLPPSPVDVPLPPSPILAAQHRWDAATAESEPDA